MAFESKKGFPLSSENFPQRLTAFNQNFTRLLFVCIYTIAYRILFDYLIIVDYSIIIIVVKAPSSTDLE